MFSVFSSRVLHLPSCKHEAWQPRTQGDVKDWRQNSFQDSRKNGKQFNENLSRETIFLATTQKEYFIINTSKKKYGKQFFIETKMFLLN